MLFCYYQWLCQPKTEMASIATNFLGLSEFAMIADTARRPNIYYLGASLTDCGAQERLAPPLAQDQMLSRWYIAFDSSWNDPE